MPCESRTRQQKRKRVREENSSQQTKRPRCGETQLSASSAHSGNDSPCVSRALGDTQVALLEALLPGASYSGQTSSPWPALFDGASGASDDYLLRNVSFDDASTLGRDSPAQSVSVNSSPVTSYSCEGDHVTQQSPHPQIMITQGSADTWTSKVGESQQAFTIYSSSTITQRKYKGPSSHQAFAQWFQLNSYVLDKDLSEHFRQGSRHSEDMDMPPFLSMPALCPDWEAYVDAYLDEVAPIYPIVGREVIVRAGTYLARFAALEHNPVSERPTMACLYACIALGARTKGHTVVAQAYIEAACSLTGYLTSQPYLESAQALLLIAIDHRGREKIGAAFLLVRQAISILNSMGLHRTPFYGNDQLSVPRQQSDRRIWYIAYALEKTMALEEGRPSSTYERMSDEIVYATKTRNCSDPWKAFVDLGVIQSKISEQFFDQQSWAVSPDHERLLALQGELDEKLTQWSDNLPEPLRPRRGLVNCPQRLLSSRTFLSLNFHHALIALHRTALIGDLTGCVATSERHDSKPHNARRLERSEGICANSARDIITTYLAFIEHKQSSPLITLNQPLLAVHVLTIYSLRYPDAWSAEADLQLLCSGIEAIKDAYETIGLPAGFCSILDTLRHAATRHKEPSTIPTPPSQQGEGLVTANSEYQDEVAQVGELSFDMANMDGFADQLRAESALKLRGVGDDLDDVLMGTWLDTPHLLDEEILDFSLWASEERTGIVPQTLNET
ncbi:hypothetical protein E4T43_02061 [Aureobasidium subglaciale]|nr:hypothetical protein E4T43_02061 [Aureobasidium subglaciale]